MEFSSILSLTLFLPFLPQSSCSPFSHFSFVSIHFFILQLSSVLETMAFHYLIFSNLFAAQLSLIYWGLRPLFRPIFEFTEFIE
jgi:hypothetical protein